MHVHTSASLRDLAQTLVELLKQSPPSDPFQPEWVAVPSDGVRRWLSLELAGHLGAAPGRADGVTANFVMPFPGALRARILEAGRLAGEFDSWQIDRMVWTVLATLRANADDPLLAAVAKDHKGVPAYSKARKIADLFDRYHVHRPEMVRAWAAGRDEDAEGVAMSSGHEGRPAHPQAWQPRLWREVRAMIGAESPAERLPGLLKLLEEGRLDVDMPDRISLFGLTVLPGGAGFLDLGRAVAADREVHLFLTEPAPLAPDLTRITGEARRMRGAFDDASVSAVAHPLLQSWGRLQRETAMLLATGGPPGPEVSMPAQGEPLSEARGRSLLEQLQIDIRANTEPSHSVAAPEADPSVRFHACHGATRQVEVLRDAILHLLADESLGLDEEDILVACPALDRFAPLIEAVFGASVHDEQSSSDGGGGQSAPTLRFRIADRSVRDVNAVLSATVDLLDLVSGRFEASAVLDFLSLVPVRTRARFTEDELARIGEWARDAGARWGLDPTHRASHGLSSDIVANTWQFALDRLLVGSAVFDRSDGLAIGDSAVIGVEGNDVDVLGRLADVLGRLTDLAHAAARPRPVAEWVGLMRAATDALFAMPWELNWQVVSLGAVLETVAETVPADPGVAGQLLTFGDVRRLFGDRLRSSPGRPDFFRGGITVSSLTPLRGVPFRAIFLLGMDERAFRAPLSEGDDLAAAAAMIGDPDRRAENRLSVLELVLAAGDRLVLLRDGNDVRTNQVVPPAVIVEELREALEATVRVEDHERFRKVLELVHPRQAFDDRCFTPGALVDREPWGFDPEDLAGTIARRGRSGARPPFLRSRLVELPEDAPCGVISLQRLHDFLRDPVKDFVERRLEAQLPRRHESVSDLLPVAADGLERWKIGDRLLTAVRDEGTDPTEWARIERKRGTLPPGTKGDEVIAEVTAKVAVIMEAAEARGMVRGPAQESAVDVVLGDGTRVVGAVPCRLAPERGPARVSYSSQKPYHLLAAWLDLVALASMGGPTPTRSLLVTRKSGDAPGSDFVDFVPAAEGGDVVGVALSALEVIVACYRSGRVEPLPIFPTLSSAAYAGKATRSMWQGSPQATPDGDQPAARLVFGQLDFRTLMELPAIPGDPPGPGGRVQRLATFLFGAMDRSVDPAP